MKLIINVKKKELLIIAEILKNRPDAVVFGSRVNSTNKDFSDLDICLKDPITDYNFELLKETFEQSDIPFNVDLVDYKNVDSSFKEIIDRDGVKLSDVVAKF